MVACTARLGTRRHSLVIRKHLNVGCCPRKAGAHPIAIRAGKTSPTATSQLDCSDGIARHILKSSDLEGDPLEFLRVSEAYWKALKNMKNDPDKKGHVIVHTVQDSLPSQCDFDVCICGGTLGLFIGLALQLRGWRVCIIEKRRVAGRTQEWNISRGELEVLVTLGLLSREELEEAIVTEFNPMRVGFKGGRDLWVRDCLNLGVSPKRLIASMRRRFEAAGGRIQENTAFKGASVHPNGVTLQLRQSANEVDVGDTNRPNAVDRLNSAVPRTAALPLEHSHGNGKEGNRNGNANGTANGRGGAYSQGIGNGAAKKHLEGLSSPASAKGTGSGSAHTNLNGNGNSRSASAGTTQVTCRLLLDCMGHYSDIVKQMRSRTRPDGMVLVVGTCAEGVPPEANRTGDLLYSFTDAQDDMQLFWEAFPAEGGAARTSYMFAYADADPARPTFEQLLDKYFQLLPAYQGVPLSDLKFKRVLFGGFPCYRDSPLKPGFDRIIQIGDASASQSPLSFGGFGSMVRHAPRLTAALAHALQEDRLSRRDLTMIHPYQPSLAVSWLFQRSMSVGVGQVAQPQLTGHPHPESQSQTQSPPTPQSQQAQVQPARPTASVQHAANQAQASGRGDASREAYAHDRTATISTTREPRAPGAASDSGPSHVTAGPMPAGTFSSGNGNGNGSGSGTGPHVQGFLARQDAGSPAGRATSESNGGDASRSGSGGAASSSTTPSRPRGWMPADQVNRLLVCNFKVGLAMGDRVLRPFLQDAMLAGPLGATMALMSVVDPLAILRVVRQLGPFTLLDWMRHFVMLCVYRVLFLVLRPLRSVIHGYAFQRWLDALEYGSGSDYKYHPPTPQRGTAATQQQQAPTSAMPDAKPAANQQQGAAGTRPAGDGNGSGNGWWEDALKGRRNGQDAAQQGQGWQTAALGST